MKITGRQIQELQDVKDKAGAMFGTATGGKFWLICLIEIMLWPIIGLVELKL